MAGTWPLPAGVRIVYKREQFRRAWLDRGGVVYVVQPEGLRDGQGLLSC